MATNSQTLNSRQVFAMDVLAELGVPQTQENANALLTQFAAEEPPGTVAAYNPGNIEVNTARLFGFNDVGSWSIAPQIATFRSFSEGVKAYAVALRRIAPDAVRDMKLQRDASQTVTDIGSSGWGTNTTTMLSILESGSERGVASRSSVAGDATSGRNTLVPPKSTGGDSIIPDIPGLPSNPLSSLASGLTGVFRGVLPFLTRIALIGGGILILLVAIFIAVKM